MAASRTTTRQTSIWVWASCALALLARLAMVLAFPAVIASDSERYRNPARVLYTYQAWEGGGPGVLAQTLFLAPGKVGLVLQVLVSAALWSAIAILVHRRVRGLGGGLLAVVVLLWSLNPWVVIWDLWYLTETLTVAGCAAAVVGSSLWLRAPRGERNGAGALALSGIAVALLTRPFEIAAILPILGLAIIIVSIRRRRVRLPLGRFGALVLVALTLFSLAEISTFNRFVGDWAGARMATRGQHPGYLAAAKAHGMPTCADIDHAFLTEQTFSTRWGLMHTTTCPGFRSWLEAGGLPWTSELVAGPRAMVADFVNPSYWLPNSVAQYAPYDPRMKEAAIRIGMPDALRLLRADNKITFAAIACAIMLALGFAFRTKDPWWILYAIVSLGWLAVFTFVSWAEGGIEGWRHVLPGLYSFVPLGVSIIAGSHATSDDEHLAAHDLPGDR